MPMNEQVASRFWPRVAKDGPDGCWEWQGCCVKTGYGQIRVGKKLAAVHRLAYEDAVGPIPEGLEIDHLCHNRRCVNPKHLEAVTHRVNIQRSRRNLDLRTHCKHGHVLTPGNIVRHTNGRRRCRTCFNAEIRASRARRKANAT
jgi:hypothetical protein